MSNGFRDVAVGDMVVRMLAGVVRMNLRVTAVDDRLIHCGAWTFERDTGYEEDDELEFGSKYGRTGSFLVREQ